MVPRSMSVTLVSQDTMQYLLELLEGLVAYMRVSDCLSLITGKEVTCQNAAELHLLQHEKMQ